MKRLNKVALATAGVLSSGVAQAALNDRGGGLLYDNVLNVTWPPIPRWADWNYSYSYNGSTDVGYNITSPHSELSYMYYVNFGLKGYSNTLGVVRSNYGVGNGNVGPVKNLQSSNAYWFGTAYEKDPGVVAWFFSSSDGDQSAGNVSNEL